MSRLLSVPAQREGCQAEPSRYQEGPTHHPACPARLALGPCGCPASASELEAERCPECGSHVRLWHAHTAEGWAEWLVCLGSACGWREAL